MLFTNSNRYNIDSSTLKDFMSIVKEGSFEINVENETYITDTYSCYTPLEFESMLAGELYPFPEHVSLVRKHGLKKITKAEAEFEASDLLRRPKIKTTIFD